uniref:Mucin-like protein n=1 Tax=Kalanchoe fedtschenkoi TaxID=63787 RepID=A0A7N0TRC4_KALFE
MRHLQRLTVASATLADRIRTPSFLVRRMSTKFNADRKSKNGDDEWNEAWETAWLPEDMKGKSRAPWEADVNFSLPPLTEASDARAGLGPEVDSETKAFVEDMNENWEQRRKSQQKMEQVTQKSDGSLYSLENIKKDYRLRKQRVHAGLWVKEIEKMEESKLGNFGPGDDIEKLLDSCAEIFDSPSSDLSGAKVPSTSELKNKPDGWETTAKAEDGNVWEMSQREEDILLQEYERRISYSKFQIASFIKTHIFSRRRPIDGWKYMIEEIGPNAKKGKGSVSRIPTLADASTQPFTEERPAMGNRPSPSRQR